LYDAERLSFYGTGVDHIHGQCFQTGMSLDRKSECDHSPQKKALGMPDCGQRLREPGNVPKKVRPFGPFVDVSHNLRTSCGDYGGYSPQKQYLPHFLRRIRPLFAARLRSASLAGNTQKRPRL